MYGNRKSRFCCKTCHVNCLLHMHCTCIYTITWQSKTSTTSLTDTDNTHKEHILMVLGVGGLGGGGISIVTGFTLCGGSYVLARYSRSNSGSAASSGSSITSSLESTMPTRCTSLPMWRRNAMSFSLGRWWWWWWWWWWWCPWCPWWWPWWCFG